MLRFRIGVSFAVFMALMIGCSTAVAPAKVKGTVTYKGQPLKGGTIAFHTEDKGSYGGSIGTDGNYEISDVPIGTMKVTVETESLNRKAAPSYPKGGKAATNMAAERMAAEKKAGTTIASSSEAKEHYVKIPAKYADKNLSGLVETLETGSQVKNIELKD
jgi:hypothetical protein